MYQKILTGVTVCHFCGYVINDNVDSGLPFFLESLPKRKASFPDVRRFLVTIPEASSQRII